MSECLVARRKQWFAYIALFKISDTCISWTPWVFGIPVSHLPFFFRSNGNLNYEAGKYYMEKWWFLHGQEENRLAKRVSSLSGLGGFARWRMCIMQLCLKAFSRWQMDILSSRNYNGHKTETIQSQAEQRHGYSNISSLIIIKSPDEHRLQ